MGRGEGEVSVRGIEIDCDTLEDSCDEDEEMELPCFGG